MLSHFYSDIRDITQGLTKGLGFYWSGFSWGAGSSAYQTEGAWDKDGKGLSIWDVFAHKKGKIFLNDTGDSSCEGYYKFRVGGGQDRVISPKLFRLTFMGLFGCLGPFDALTRVSLRL